MIDSDPLSAALRSDRDGLVGLAPAPHYAGLWRKVEVRRERALQRLSMLAAAIPTASLFLGGVVSLLLGGGLLASLPLLAVALWLVVEGLDLSTLAAGESGGPKAAGREPRFEEVQTY